MRIKLYFANFTPTQNSITISHKLIISLFYSVKRNGKIFWCFLNVLVVKQNPNVNIIIMFSEKLQRESTSNGDVIRFSSRLADKNSNFLYQYLWTTKINLASELFVLQFEVHLI